MRSAQCFPLMFIFRSPTEINSIEYVLIFYRKPAKKKYGKMDENEKIIRVFFSSSSKCTKSRVLCVDIDSRYFTRDSSWVFTILKFW